MLDWLELQMQIIFYFSQTLGQMRKPSNFNSSIGRVGCHQLKGHYYTNISSDNNIFELIKKQDHIL